MSADVSRTSALFVRGLLLGVVFVPWSGLIIAAVTLLAPDDILARSEVAQTLVSVVKSWLPQIVGDSQHYAFPQVAALTYSMLVAMYPLVVLVTLLAASFLVRSAAQDGSGGLRRMTMKEHWMFLALFVVGIASLLAYVLLPSAYGIGSQALRTSRWTLAFMHCAMMYVGVIVLVAQATSTLCFIKYRMRASASTR